MLVICIIFWMTSDNIEAYDVLCNVHYVVDEYIASMQYGEIKEQKCNMEFAITHLVVVIIMASLPSTMLVFLLVTTAAYVTHCRLMLLPCLYIRLKQLPS